MSNRDRLRTELRHWLDGAPELRPSRLVASIVTRWIDESDESDLVGWSIRPGCALHDRSRGLHLRRTVVDRDDATMRSEDTVAITDSVVGWHRSRQFRERDAWPPCWGWTIEVEAAPPHRLLVDTEA